MHQDVSIVNREKMMHIQNSATQLKARQPLSISIARRLGRLLQGLLGAIVVLCLPPGAGMMLIALAAAATWRLAIYVSSWRDASRWPEYDA